MSQTQCNGNKALVQVVFQGQFKGQQGQSNPTLWYFKGYNYRIFLLAVSQDKTTFQFLRSSPVDEIIKTSSFN